MQLNLASFNAIKRAYKKKEALERKAKRKEKRKLLRVGRPRLISLPKLKKQLDDLFSAYIRLRDKKRFKGMCAFGCGRPIFCCFHFIHRSASNHTRWNGLNAVASCIQCNGRMEYEASRFWLWYHVHPEYNFGTCSHAVIDDLSRDKKIMGRIELETIKTDLEAKIQNLNKNDL